ncbi:major capsid protein [Enterococcus casseliflavus]|uniref:major capsid protein n=1 Tax=Enterococcus casseliflavus TaxID=37734 RepID=UPI002DBC8D5D|nr:major capsid protein [Enterococcus casseliflavus]MEB6146385.1 major capsid protein [Enterococcus casseliflavus]
MPTIMELFTQNEVLNYVRDREYKPLLGETLFPERKQPSLKLDQLSGGSRIPIAASIHDFDTEAEIGSRIANKQELELSLIKRKMQLKETDIIALENPRTPAEQAYLVGQVYNDIDSLVAGVRARVEAMRMEVLAAGQVTVKENGLNFTLDYHVPAEHKEALTGTNVWTNENSDPLADIERWIDALDTKPTRALTSRKIYRALATHPKIIAAIFGKDSGRVVSQADLDAFMETHGYPVIRTYDEKYKVQEANGTYTTKKYFPENKFAMFNDDLLGETLYGPTAEETRLTRDPAVDTSLVGNVLASVYDETRDPVGTWTKAVATALPSFAAADEVFQAQPI